ncbi:MAG: hypothetical protein Q9217_005158 [Psora testacea]
MSSQSTQSTREAAGTAGNESTPTTAGAAGTARNESTPTTAGAAGTARNESPSGKVNATDHEPHVGQKRKEITSSDKKPEISSSKIDKPRNKRKTKQKTQIDFEKIARAEAQLAALRSGDPMDLSETDDDPEQQETQKDKPDTSMDESKPKSLQKPQDDGDSSSMSKKQPQKPVPPSVPSDTTFFDKKSNLMYAERNDLDADDLEITPEGSAIIRDAEGNIITPTYLVQFAGRGSGNSRKAVAKYGDGREAIYRIENVTGRVLNVPNITDPSTRPGEAFYYRDGVKVYRYNKGHCKGMLAVAIETDLDGEDAVRTLDPSLYGYDEGKMKKIPFPSSRQCIVWEIEGKFITSWETRTVVQRVWSKKEVCHRDIYRRATMDYQQFCGGEHTDLGPLERPDTKSPSPELSRRRRPSIVARSPGFSKGPKATPKVKQEPQSLAGIAKTTAPPQGGPNLEKVVQLYCQMFQKDKDSLTTEERFGCIKLFREEGGQF